MSQSQPQPISPPVTTNSSNDNSTNPSHQSPQYEQHTQQYNESENHSRFQIFPAKVLFIIIAPLTSTQSGLTLLRQPFFLVMLAIVFIMTIIFGILLFRYFCQDLTVDKYTKTYQTLNGGVYLYLFIRFILTLVILLLALTWLSSDLSSSIDIDTLRQQQTTQIFDINSIPFISTTSRQFGLGGPTWIVIALVAFVINIFIQLGIRIASSKYRKVEGIQPQGVVSFYSFVGFGFGASSSIEVASSLAKLVGFRPFSESILFLIPPLHFVAIIGAATLMGISAARRDVLGKPGREWIYAILGALLLTILDVGGYVIITEATFEKTGSIAIGIAIPILIVLFLWAIVYFRYTRLTKESSVATSMA